MSDKEKPFQLEVASSRLVKEVPLLSDVPITSPKAAIRLFQKELEEMDREMVYVINVTAAGCPINCSLVSMGSLDMCICNPREVLRFVILSNASKFLLLHNHPSGTLTPSADDVKVTDRLSELGELLGIPLLDHVIVTPNTTEYYSMKAGGKTSSTSKTVSAFGKEHILL